MFKALLVVRRIISWQILHMDKCMCLVHLFYTRVHAWFDAMCVFAFAYVAHICAIYVLGNLYCSYLYCYCNQQYIYPIKFGDITKYCIWTCLITSCILTYLWIWMYSSGGTSHIPTYSGTLMFNSGGSSFNHSSLSRYLS